MAPPSAALGSQRGRSTTPALKRSNTTASSTSTVSIKNPNYWNSLMCTFAGVNARGPDVGVATSINNRDYFPDGPPTRDSSRSRPPSSRRSTTVKRSNSFLRTSFAGKRMPSTSGVLGKMKFGRSSSDSVVLEDADELAVAEGDEPAPNAFMSAIQEEDDQYLLPNDEILSHIGQLHHMHEARGSQIVTSPAQSRAIPILKDGQTIWIPEHILEQFSANNAPSQPIPASIPATRGPKSDMRIVIPQHENIAPPQLSASSVYSPRTPARNLRLPSQPATRPVHPLEQEANLDYSPAQSSPMSDYRKSSASSSEMQSPVSRYSSATSQSSFSPATPLDIQNPLSAKLDRLWLAADSPEDAIEDDDAYAPGSDIPRFRMPRAAPQPPVLPQKSRRRSGPGVQTSSQICSFSAISPVPEESSNAISKHMTEQIPAEAAQAVLVHILGAVNGLDDLFAFARVNKGFYRVLKQQELPLMKKALCNASPAAWELREVAPRNIAGLEHRGSDYTPTTYMQFLKRDTGILAALKSLILARCQSFLRADTIEALGGRNHVRSREIDDALWRIWSFCTIFGSGTGREDDLADQICWLQGESLSQTESASFGLGNAGGLSSDALYDMNEMWNCIKSLLSGLQGRTRVTQARAHGVFIGHDIELNNFEREEAVLEEWINHISTLGLSTILDLSSIATSPEPTAFVVAASVGWTQWRPTNKSRATFLKDAVSRVYEEQVASAQPSVNSADSAEQAARRRRSTGLAKELRHTKRTTDFNTVPVTEERPMSSWVDWVKVVESPIKSLLGTVTENQDEAKVETPEPRGRQQTQAEVTASEPRWNTVPVHRSEASPAGSGSSASGSSGRAQQRGLAASSSNASLKSASSTYTSAPSSGTNSRATTPHKANRLQDLPPAQSNLLPLPLKSGERVALARLVAMGWKAEQAREALRAVGSDEANELNTGTKLAERAVQWLAARTVV